MSERADLRLASDEVYYCHSDDAGDVYHDKPARPITPAEVLMVLLPDVDWETLRRVVALEVSEAELFRESLALSTDVARRLLAVYDGKDGA